MSRIVAALVSTALLTGPGFASDGQSALERLRARRAGRTAQAQPAAESGTPSLAARAGNGIVTLSAMPTDIPSFLAIRDQIARTPEGGAVMFILAAHLYGIDRKLGLDAFTIAFDRANLQESGKGYQGFAPAGSVMYLIDKLQGRPWVAQTYVQGTSPADGYALPTPPYVFRSFNNQVSVVDEVTRRIMFHTSGADNPRPLTVRVNDKGIWKVKEGSSLFTDMKKPGHGVAVSDDL